ncbi:hypothetical protein [Clostridium butyricum]|uniref:hypothetical protein n=1 Tax=Clostridium butyricum TaxID=1492 RepID=UPI0023309E2C|nr:hypothetical protein [Clostridium butyricum]MDB2162295.1 hypothetical protein [Clostridium butyricum]
MNEKFILNRFRNLSNQKKQEIELKAMLNGVSIDQDVIPIIAGIAAVSMEAAKLFIDNIEYLN